MAFPRDHNRPFFRASSMYAIVFDFDTQILEQVYPNASLRNAYSEVRQFLTQRGFEWKQGSAYFGDDTVDAVRCVRVVQRLARKYPWFTAVGSRSADAEDRREQRPEIGAGR